MTTTYRRRWFTALAAALLFTLSLAPASQATPTTLKKAHGQTQNQTTTAQAEPIAQILAQAKAGVDFDRQELLIRFKANMSPKGQKAIQEMGARLLEKLSRIDISRIKLPNNLTVEQALAQLAKLPFVEFVEPNYIHKAMDWTPSDPHWNRQWGMTNANVVGAWGVEIGKKSTIIAIVDTGVDVNHLDLKTKIVPGYNFVHENTNVTDNDGHGTHCAGIAAALANDGVGVAGVCSNCSIMPIKVLGKNGGLNSDVANGIIWAADHGAHVISMSLGCKYPSNTIQQAIEYAASKGAILVAAAGNDGNRVPHYPAYYDHVIAVGAINSSNRRASFSSYGDWVDVAAPGDKIYSTMPNGGYAYLDGTSMATPFVAGLAGLLVSRMGTSATPQKVRDAILNTAAPMDTAPPVDTAPGKGLAGLIGAILNITAPTDTGLGKGRIDMAAAVKSVQPGTPLPPTPPATGAPPTQVADPQPQPAPTPAPGPAPAQGVTVAGYKQHSGRVLKESNDATFDLDDQLLILRSVESGRVRALDVEFWATLPTGTTTISLSVDGRYYEAPAPVAVYLWNTQTANWDAIGNGQFGTDDTNITLTRANAATYLDDNGQVRLRLYRQTHLWTTFDMGINQLKIYPGNPPAKAVSAKKK
ncbi:MAG: S8 family peptidase [Proteobacteria bacterium]|nr:S8 family peptidase [Pseudomonadota bacterium]